MPKANIIAFIHGIYDKPTASGQNEYYKYCLYDGKFQALVDNTLNWRGFKITISKKDGWLQPSPNWSGSHHYEIRIGVTIEIAGNKPVILNFLHWNHTGSAFKELFDTLLQAEKVGVLEAVNNFLKNNK